MSPLRLGCAVAAVTALLWWSGVMVAWNPPPGAAADLRWYFMVAYEAFYGSLRAGAPLVWNPYQLCGLPWLGTLQAGFFYPPHLLYVVLPTSQALAVSIALHLALAAGGAAAFARRAGLSAAAATLASVVFVYAGMLRTVQLWPYSLEASVWLPIGGLAILDVTAGRVRRGTIGLAAASGASWLAGSPQATVFLCYTWAALLVSWVLVARPPLATAARALAGLVLGFGAGVLIAAVALLPAWELAREGIRRTSALDGQAMYTVPLPPRAVWALWLDTGSPILLGVALALVPFALLSSSRALLVWGLGTAGIAAVFALGPHTSLIRAYLLLPFVGWFRNPYRVLIVGQFALAAVAGLGIDAAARVVGWRYLPGLVLVAILAGAAVDGLRRPQAPLPVPYAAEHRAAYTRLATVAAELRVWPYSHGLLLYSLPPKLPSLTHVRAITDYEPLSLRRQHEYFTFFGEGVHRGARGSENELIGSLVARPGEAAPATRRRLLDLAGVRFMLLPTVTTRRREVAAFLREAGLEWRPPLEPGLELYENPHVLPRAFVTYNASAAPPAEQLLATLSGAAFDPLVESFVEDAAGLRPAASAPRRGAAATFVRDDAQVVEIDATLEAPGLVVLADTFFPGWTATVDGVAVPILATNHLFRGVRAPAGTHRVRFEYRPRSLRVGAALSLVTLLALAAIGARRSSRRSLESDSSSASDRR